MRPAAPTARAFPNLLSARPARRESAPERARPSKTSCVTPTPATSSSGQSADWSLDPATAETLPATFGLIGRRNDLDVRARQPVHVRRDSQRGRARARRPRWPVRALLGRRSVRTCDGRVDELSVEQPNGALRMTGEACVVRHHNDRRAALVQLAQEFHNRLAVARVEITGRLVG